VRDEETGIERSALEHDHGQASVIITMSTGQWDGFLQAAYDYGHTLLELDENEHPVRAYRKAPDISDALDAAAYFNNEYLA